MNARTQEPDLTREQLQLALRQLWRPGWPETVDAVLAHPLRSKCLLGMARQLSRASVTAAARRSNFPTAPVPPTPGQPRRVQAPEAPRGRWPKPAPFDARKAAANDLDD